MIGLKKSFLKGNADKCHLITSSKTPVGIEVANVTIMSEEKVKLLGIHIENRLNFDYYISQLCKKAGKKFHALTQVFKYMDISQGKLIANAFIMSQFSYCPLIYKAKNKISPEVVNSLFDFTNKNYNLRNLSIIKRNRYFTVRYGSESP